MHTTALPAGGLYRRATVTRRTPAILAGFIDAYRAELQCSRKAAAWELREFFAELTANLEHHGNSRYLDRRVCWAGTVANPATPRGAYKIGAHQLAAYFEGHMMAAGAPVEFVECSTQEGEPYIASDAAIAFAPEHLARMFEGLGRPVPAFLLRDPTPAGTQAPPGDDLPKGRRLGSVRTLVHGLIEIAANAARADRESEFCRQVADLDRVESVKVLARRLDRLAKNDMVLDDFPSRETLRDIL